MPIILRHSYDPVKFDFERITVYPRKGVGCRLQTNYAQFTFNALYASHGWHAAIHILKDKERNAHSAYIF